MRHMYRLPFIAGLATLVLSVLVATVQLSTSRNLTTGQLQATSHQASLTLHFSPPDLISVSVNSDRAIGGIDLDLHFDSGNIAVLPSTLTAGGQFTTTGVTVDESAQSVSFSAIPMDNFVTTGIIGSFQIRKNNENIQTTEILFNLGEDQTAVFDIETGENILKSAQPLSFSIPVQ